MRLGSLFSGYGGLDMACEQVFSARTVWFCENDPVVSAVFQAHWPQAEPLGDITNVDWGKVPPVDVLCGGFPCQDLSASGRRLGISSGTRSGLWHAMAEAVRVLRPSWVVIENVTGLLSTPAIPERTDDDEDEGCGVGVGPGVARVVAPAEPGRAMGVVCGGLADLGYDAAWLVLPASAAGACHQRRRVFVLAWPAAEDPVRV